MGVDFVLCNFFAGTGNAEIQLHVPTTVYAGEATIVNCTGSEQDFQHVMPMMSLTLAGDDCIEQGNGFELKLFNNYYQKSFTVICKKGRHTIECSTNSNTMDQNAEAQLQGVLYFFIIPYNIMKYVLILQLYRGR